MPKYRIDLPQLTDSTYMTDGGIETDLIFNHGIDLPEFAAFDLLKNEEGREILRRYFMDYLEISKVHCNGFILESPTYRTNPDWILKIGYPPESLIDIIATAVQELEKLRDTYERDDFKIPISVCVGPRGDGYSPDNPMTVEIAESYHAAQIQAAAETNADLVTALTMNYSEEAIGIVYAAKRNNIPVVISFTVETDGKLPSGETLEETITLVDKMTDNYVSYFMINCAHPDHFADALEPDSKWTKRIQGIRANASCKSHAELDESETLDAGDKNELARKYHELRPLLPNLHVIGGCCGTDHSHMKLISDAWFKETTV